MRGRTEITNQMQPFFEIVSSATTGKIDRATWEAAGFLETHGDGAPRVLDIGCGYQKHPGSVGVDLVPVRGVDIVADFTRGLPFADNSVGAIFTAHTLEHAHNLLFVMEEFWRVCKPNAAVYLVGPHATCPQTTWSDPTHQRGLTIETFRYFDVYHYFNFYTKARFKIEWANLFFTMASHRTGQGIPRRLVTWLIEGLANRSPQAQHRCERWWGPWVGIEELHMVLRVVK